MDIQPSRWLKVGSCLLLGGLLAGCSVQPVNGDVGAAHAAGETSAARHENAEAAMPAAVPAARTARRGADTSAASSPAAAASASTTPVAHAPEEAASAVNEAPAAVEVNRSAVTAYRNLRFSGPQEGSQEADDGASSGTGILVGKGLASWYGSQFHGRRTASGERFDRGELTAAHPTLPFGSKVCVRSQTTGKTVMVRINDRGPFAPGRVIDLSEAAAQELGMQGLGIKPVELWQLSSKRESCPDDLLLANDDPEEDPDTGNASPSVARTVAKAAARPARVSRSQVKNTSSTRAARTTKVVKAQAAGSRAKPKAR